MSAKTKVTKTKTALKQETYNLSEGLVAELPSNLARGLSGRRDFGPRMGVL